jgi:18S rRNA (guanine1575-N7)-methyltransferase
MATRPELVAPPEVFYNDEEARKYTSNSHMIDTQARCWRRCCGAQRMPSAAAGCAG